MRLKNYQDQSTFLEEVRVFARSYVADLAQKIDKTETLPPDITAKLAERRLFALERLMDSGSRLSFKTRSLLIIEVIQTLAYASASIAKMVLDQNLGQIQMFQDLASDELQSKYILEIRRGHSQMAFLMTEPQTGSSPAMFQSTARRCEGGYLINGAKDWITGAQTRSLFLVVAKSDSTNDFGLFFIDRREKRAHQSIRISARKRQLGLRGLGEHCVTFKNTFVADRNVLIHPRKDSIKKIMKHYNMKRCGQAALAIGLSKSSLDFASGYLRERHPGKDGGFAFQNAEFTLADLYTLARASEQLNKWAVEEIVAGDTTGVPSSMAKLFATEAAVKITNSAIHLCGAEATTERLPLERFMRDARMLTILGGTSEIQKRTISRGIIQSGRDKASRV